MPARQTLNVPHQHNVTTRSTPSPTLSQQPVKMLNKSSLLQSGRSRPGLLLLGSSSKVSSSACPMDRRSLRCAAGSQLSCPTLPSTSSAFLNSGRLKLRVAIQENRMSRVNNHGTARAHKR